MHFFLSTTALFIYMLLVADSTEQMLEISVDQLLLLLYASTDRLLNAQQCFCQKVEYTPQRSLQGLFLCFAFFSAKSMCKNKTEKCVLVKSEALSTSFCHVEMSSVKARGSQTVSQHVGQ